ncbi:orotidine-5'-phosphate decarboxylase [candidate division GN15 bacterium]|nr:orotidine-5'-phosphate decarboxylase [candidate division GN15 bacterium]
MGVIRQLRQIQAKNKSMVCVGLDLDPKRMPSGMSNDIKSMYSFAHKIIQETSDIVCAYKPNLAFFESLGADGMSLLKVIIERIPDEIPVILDAKRGDIGNTATHYAQALFDRLGGDWVTLNPYMGYDTLRPFLEYKDKGVFILCLTSNTGARDFQMLESDGKPLYQHVAEKVAYWNKDQTCGLVVGATQPEQLERIRSIAGEMPLLIPGVGAQGGSLEKAARLGTDNFRKLALINVSRSVLYASSGEDFATKAREEVLSLNRQINDLRSVKQDSGESSAENVDQVTDSSHGNDEPANSADRENTQDDHSRDSEDEDQNRPHNTPGDTDS